MINWIKSFGMICMAFGLALGVITLAAQGFAEAHILCFNNKEGGHIFCSPEENNLFSITVWIFLILPVICFVLVAVMESIIGERKKQEKQLERKMQEVHAKYAGKDYAGAGEKNDSSAS